MNLFLLKTYCKFLLFSFLILFSTNNWSQTFTQITSVGELVDGTYLFVGDGIANDGIMLNTASTTPFINFTTVTNPGNSITSGVTTDNEFQVTVSSGVITIFNSSVGYVSWGRTGNIGNTANFYNDSPENNEKWTVSVTSGLWTLANVATPARSLQWNNSSPRFACYTTNQVRLKLYKKNVVASPIVTGGTVNGTVGTALNYQINATNAPSSYAVSSGTLPAGLSLNTSSGVISGTPITAASSSVNVTASNGAGTSAPATLNFEIAKGNQTITFAALADRQYGDANFNLTATASSGLAVSYISSNTSVATISGNTVTIVGEGTTNITASQAGNANFNAAANVIRSLTVTKRQLTVTGLTGVNKVYDATTTASATGTATLSNILAGDESNVSLSGTPNFVYATSTVGINKTINVSGFTLSGPSAGNYDLIQPTLTASITAKPITVSGATANNKVYDGTTTATIVGGTLIGVEAVDAANVSLSSTGSFDTADVGNNKPVTVSISGSAAFNYSLTQPGITANITKANQIITFNELPPLNLNSSDLNLNDYASASSGLALTYQSSNTAVVTVSGNTLTIVGAGSAVITASQDGDSNFNPAANATQSITVSQAPLLIAGWDFQTTTNGGTALQSAPNTPKQITANFGSGELYLDGTNFSSDFETATSGNELNSFAGSALNTNGTSFSTITTGAASLALVSGTNSTANGKSAVFVLNMTDYTDLEISYAVQRTGSGFTSNEWEYSLDGTVWNPIGTINSIPSSFGIVTLPVTSSLNNAGTAYIRLTVTGSTASGSNNRLDNIKFEATITPISIPDVIWNGTEWSNVDGPDENTDAFIEGAYDTFTYGPFTSKNVTIDTGGSLVVSSGDNVLVYGDVINTQSAASLVVQNTANLVQLNVVNNNTGDMTVEVDSNPLFRLDYTLWSSPVVGQNLKDFSPLTMNNRFYEYNTTTNTYSNASINPVTDNFQTAKGYLVRMPDNWSSSVASPFEGNFVGQGHNGIINLNLENIGVSQRFNAIGNPYPSTIDIATFLSVNGPSALGGNDAITGSMWFWRKTNSPTNSSYCVYNGASNVYTSNGEANAVSNNATFERVLGVGQGFIVEAAGTSTEIQFNNDMRIGNTSGQFFRNAQTNSVVDENPTYWLNLTRDNGAFYQMAVSYNEGATTGVDIFDSKAFNNGSIGLNSLVAESEFAIQGRPAPFNNQDIVPLSFKSNELGNYTISLDNTIGIFNDVQDIFVEDLLTQVIHNLKEGTYSFTSEAGLFNDRFRIVYMNETLGVVQNSKSDVVVYIQGKQLFIQTSNNYELSSVNLFDLSGRKIQSQEDINSKNVEISLTGISKQALLVQIQTRDGILITKKIVF